METKRKALLIPINSRGEILIQDRRGHKLPEWGFWGGGIEADEDEMAAVIRETREELNLILSGDDLCFIGSDEVVFCGARVERSFFLYHTNQELFHFSEGAGACWFSYEDARRKLSIYDQFDKVVGMIEKAQGC